MTAASPESAESMNSTRIELNLNRKPHTNGMWIIYAEHRRSQL